MQAPSVVVLWARVTDPADAVAASHALTLRAAALVDDAAQAATLGHRCGRCGSTAHGTPHVVGARASVSLARTPGTVVAAASFDPSIAGIGVDVERSDRAFPGLREVAMSPAELAASPSAGVGALLDGLRTWVRKEALLKASGTGLAIDPATITVEGTTVVSGPQGPWFLADLTLADGLVTTVAARGSATASLLVREEFAW